MTQYNFKIDPKEPRDEQIARHKDFRKVMENYQRMTRPLYRTPLYRFRRVFYALLIVGAVTWLVAEFGDGDEQTKKKIPTKDSVKKDSIRLKDIPKSMR